MPKQMIDVRNLVKRYAKSTTNAVDNISFTVGTGEFFALLGPNGAGKTTTISILSTTLAKTSGTVSIAGTDIDQDPSGVRRNIGIIFQNPSLDSNLTAEENIRFHATLYGLYPFRPTYSLMPTSYKKKISELSELLGLQKEIYKPVHTYSGGMKRKLEIIRSFLHQPKVLFLDEPTSGLDPISRKNLWDYLLAVAKKQRITILLTTHYLEEAEGVDNVAIINHGKIISYGTPSQIKKDLIDEYLLIDARDRKALIHELTKQVLPFEQTDHVKVSLKGISAQEAIQRIHTKLTYVRVHVPTLEEAYLEIIKNDTE